MLPQGFEQGIRLPAIEGTTARFESLIAAQVMAGADLESISSNLTLTVFFFGDITGATQLGEGLFGVDLASNQMLGAGESIRRGVQGGSMLVIIGAGPKAFRIARARSAALAAARRPTTATAVRERVLANIGESQAARAASRFQVFAAHEAALPALMARGGALPVRIGQAGVIETTLALERSGFTVVGREITMETVLARTRLDLLVEAPQAGGIVPGTAVLVRPLQRFFVEVKTGSGRLSPNQRLAFPIIRKTGGIPRGLRALEAGLIVGKRSGAFEVIIVRRP